MNDIARASEIGDNGHSARGKSFEDYTRTVVAKRWKYHYIGRSHLSQDFRMVEPTMERDSFFNIK